MHPMPDQVNFFLAGGSFREAVNREFDLNHHWEDVQEVRHSCAVKTGGLVLILPHSHPHGRSNLNSDVFTTSADVILV